jgi:hypothetical protein
MKLFATMAIALALPALAVSATPRAGLQGLVLLDPGHPVCETGEPCTRPAPNVRLVFSRSGRIVARTRSALDGSYRLRLKPGAYAVSSPNAARTRPLKPRRVVVPRGRYGRVVFRLDTGIR